MRKFYKDVDCGSRRAMKEFLTGHFRYHTGNSWNRSTSYACNMKIYNLGLPGELEDKLYGMLGCQEVNDMVDDLIREFNAEHGYRWQAGFNGRSGGYLVLYQGEISPTGHKSYCRCCGQRNFTSVEETGNMCGRCRKPGRVDFTNPPMEVSVYPGRSTDMDEDFKGWGMDDLRDRVTLVQEFDRLADMIVEEARYIAGNYSVAEEVYYEQRTMKVLERCAV